MTLGKKMTSQKKLRHTLVSPAMLLGLIVSLLSSPFLSPAQTQDNKSFSLASAQQFAIEHSYDIKKSSMDIEAARKKLRETIATGLPQVSSSIGYMNNLEIVTMLIPNFFEGKFDEKIPVQFGTQHNVTFNVQVEQLLFNGSYIVGLKTSNVYQRLADENFERTQLNVKEAVASTYYLILVAEASEQIIQANLKNLEKTLYEIRERYKEGFVAETDADLVQISVTALKNSLQTIGRQKQTALDLLKFQMGLDLAEKITLTEKLENILAQVNVESLVSHEFNLNSNVDYRLMVTQEKLSDLALQNEKAKYWPTIAAFYTYQRNAMRDSFNFFNSDKSWYRAQILGINISIPIFKSGAQRARVQQAALTRDQARTNLQQVSQGILLDFSRTRNALVSAQENYLAAQENMALSQKIYDVTLIKYNEGVASSMELTQTNDRFLLAQSNYIQAMAELLNTKNALDKLSNNY